MEPKLLRALFINDNNIVDLTESRSPNYSTYPKIKNITGGSGTNEALTKDIFIFSPSTDAMPAVINGKILVRYIN